MFGFGMEYEGAAFWLPVVWAGLLALAVAMYVVIDGFDLGVGILFTAARKGNWRDRMMLSVAPIWDGNETWLVLGGGGLFAVFSVAYAILLPALYIPIILMLIALIFRGVAFEFRFKADRSQFVWDNAFHYGSLLATFAQGMVLGAFVQGFKVEGRGFAGGTMDWLTPFSVLTGIGLVCGYGLLGATWCVMKTSGELEIWARRKSLQFLAATIVSMAVVSAWVPFLGLDIQWRWIRGPRSRGDGPRRLGHLPGHPQRAPRGALPAHRRAVPARLPRPRHQPVPLHRAAALHDLAGSQRGQRPAIRPRRLFRGDAADPGLYRLRLLGLPREGGGRPRIRGLRALSGGSSGAKGRRLLWFVAFYAASLVTFTALVYFLRAIVKG
jgi:hypothetical protein